MIQNFIMMQLKVMKNLEKVQRDVLVAMNLE